MTKKKQNLFEDEMLEELYSFDWSKLERSEKARRERQKKILIDTLSPLQREHLDSILWLYNQQRASGKTYLLCVVAIINVLYGIEGIVVDHYPYQTAPYIPQMLRAIADKIKIRIKIRELGRNAYRVELE